MLGLFEQVRQPKFLSSSYNTQYQTISHLTDQTNITTLHHHRQTKKKKDHTTTPPPPPNQNQTPKIKPLATTQDQTPKIKPSRNHTTIAQPS